MKTARGISGNAALTESSSWLPPLVPPTAPSGAVASPNSGAPTIRVTVPRPATTVATRPTAPPSAPLAGTRGARDVGVGRSTPAKEPPPLRDGVGSAAFDKESTRAFIESRRWGGSAGSSAPALAPVFRSARQSDAARGGTAVAPGASPRSSSEHPWLPPPPSRAAQRPVVHHAHGTVHPDQSYAPVDARHSASVPRFGEQVDHGVPAEEVPAPVFDSSPTPVPTTTGGGRSAPQPPPVLTGTLDPLQHIRDLAVAQSATPVSPGGLLDAGVLGGRATTGQCRGTYRQQAVTSYYSDPLEHAWHLQIMRFIVESGMPFNSTKLESFKRMFTMIIPPGVPGAPAPRLPSYHMLRTTLLDELDGEVQNCVRPVLDTSRETGCTIKTDGWTNIRGQTLCNYLVGTKIGVVYASTDVMRGKKDISKILRRYKEMIAFCLSACRDIDREQQDAIVEVFHRRRTMFKTPAHTAAMLLDPEFRDAALCDDAEVQQALVEALVQFGYPEDSPQHREFQRAVAKLHTREPPFDELTMRRAADIFDHPASFWSSKKAKFPHTAAVEDEAAVDQQLVRGTGVLAKVTEEELSLARERMLAISRMGAKRRVAESDRRRPRAGGRGRGGRGRAGVGGRTRGDAGSAPRTRRQRTDGGIRRARMRWDEGDFLFDSTSSDDDDFFASGTHASMGDDRGDADDRGDDRGDGDPARRDDARRDRGFDEFSGDTVLHPRESGTPAIFHVGAPWAVEQGLAEEVARNRRGGPHVATQRSLEGSLEAASGDFLAQGGHGSQLLSDGVSSVHPPEEGPQQEPHRGPAETLEARPPVVIRSDGGEGVSEDTAQPGSADGGRSFRGGIERRGSSTAHPSIVRPSTHDVGDGHTDEPRPHLTGMRDIMCPPPSRPSAADPAAHGQATSSALPTRSFYDGAGMDRRAGDIGQTSAYGPANVPAGVRSIGNVDGTCHDSTRAYEEQHGRPIRAKTSDVNDTRTATARLSRARKKGTGVSIPYHRRRLHPFFCNRDETGQMPAAADGQGGAEGGDRVDEAGRGEKRRGDTIILHDDNSTATEGGETTGADDPDDSDYVPRIRTADGDDGGGRLVRMRTGPGPDRDTYLYGKFTRYISSFDTLIDSPSSDAFHCPLFAGVKGRVAAKAKRNHRAPHREGAPETEMGSKDVVVGRAAFAAAASAHAGRSCWVPLLVHAFPAMVRRRKGATPANGPASSRRQTIGRSGVVKAPDHWMVRRRQGARPLDGPTSLRLQAIQASGIPAARRCCSRCCCDIELSVDVVVVRDAMVADVVVGGTAFAAAAAAHAGSLCVCCSCAPAFPLIVRRRQGARPSNGPASSRRQTIGWSGVAEAPDHWMVWVRDAVVVDVMVGGAALAAASAAHAGSLCLQPLMLGPSAGAAAVPLPFLRWSGVVKAPDGRMVRHRQGAGPSRRPAYQQLNVVVIAVDVESKCGRQGAGPYRLSAQQLLPLLCRTVVVACEQGFVSRYTCCGRSCWRICPNVHQSCCGSSDAGSLPLLALPMVRRRQGARPPDGPASSRRQTIGWYAVVEAQDHQMVRRRLGARPSACSSGVSTPKVVGRAVTFQEKYWAIDWHLGMKVPCCGPVVFLRDESGGYYPCEGIKTYSFDKNMPDEEYMRFHLTTCFDIDGQEVPDNYKLVSLHVEKFQGYGTRAASMSPFDKSKKKDASQMVMLRPFEFLKRVNCYKVSNHIAMGQAVLRTAVFVSSPKTVGKSCGEPKTSARISKSGAASTQAKSVSKSASLLRPKGVSPTQAPSHAEYAARVSLTPPGGVTDHEDDDENSEEDSRFFNSDGGRWPDGNDAKDTEGDEDEPRFRDGAHDEEGRLEDGFAEGDGSEGQEDGGHEGDGSEEEENEEASDEDAAEREDSYEGGSEGDEGGADDDDGGNTGSQKRREQSSRATSHDGAREDDDVLHGTQRSVCMRKRKMRCGRAEEEKQRQAKLISLQASTEDYKRFLEAQSAKPAKEKRERTPSSQRPKKKAKAEETKEVADSGDEAAGVDPRHTTSKPGEFTNDTIDTTRCFFLEYDENGNAIDPSTQVFVDVVKILSNPSEGVQYNHRSLNEMLVTSIRDAMKHPEKQKEWDRNTWILGPVVEVQKDGRKQWERVKPEEWDDDKVASYHWYTVAGQHTAEAAKRLVAAKSSAACILGRRGLCILTMTIWRVPGQDGVRPVDQEGKAGEAAGPGPAAKTMKGKKVLVHYVQSNKSSSGFYVCINDPPASAWKVFRDFTSREKEMALEKILAGHVVVTSGRAFVKKVMNMQDLYVEVRRERYMVRMFNYILFKIKQRSEEEWNDKFFIGYDTIMRRFASRGLTTEKWEETKSKIVAEMTVNVPKRLGGVDEAKLGKGNIGGHKVTTAIYMECPYFLKFFVHKIFGAVEQLRDELRRISSNAQHIMWDKRKDHTTYLPVCITPMDALHPVEDLTPAVRKLSCHLAVLDLAPALKVEETVLRNVFRWDGVRVLPGRWRRYSEAASSCAQVGNLPLRGRDSMTIVLHDTDNNLKKVMVAKPHGNTLFDTHYVEELFVRCTKEAISVRGDSKPVYGIWEREPAKMKDLCTWFSKEGEGVLLLGNVQTGTTWDLLRSGRHVVACDSSSNLMEYSTLFIDRHVHNPDNRCHFERPKPQHRADRDMFLKLGKKRDSLWSYLFCNAPATPTDADYLHRKVIAIQHLQGYHNAKRSANEIFLGRCEHLWFERKRVKIDAKVYCEVMDVGEQFDIMDSEEETEDEEIDLPLPDAHQNAVRDETPPLSAMGGEQAMEEDVGGTIASTKPDNVMRGTTPKTGGAMEGSTSKCGMKEATPRFVSLVRRVRNDIEGAADDETQNVARVDKESVDDQDGMDIEDDTLFHISDDMAHGYPNGWEKRVFRERVIKSRFYEIAKDNLSTRVKQANREAPDHKISDKVNSLFEFLRDNHLLEYCAAFYDKKSSPSYGAVIWSMDYRATDCMYDSDILVGCSQGLEGHTSARKKIDSAAAGGGGESVADKEGHLRMQNAMGDEFSERSSSTPQPTLRPSEGISVARARSETTPTTGGEVVGDDGKVEKIEEDQRQKASDEEGSKFQAHEVVKAVAGNVDSHSKQSQGTHDTTVITTQTQGTDEDTREQSAHEKDGGEGPVLMECTGSKMQIVSESTMGERRANVEGVSGAEHEKVPSTANREREEENENEEETNKSQSVINLVDPSGENEETSDKEEAKESREESQERERDLSEESEGICGRKKKSRQEKEECRMRRSKRFREKKAQYDV
ncbi:hypothetical protein CBR_g28053 [Chara braunii]|uniref:DUF659 domain-containing protein n=1 Tax=Chara braunii TaxID=69332 RepID=A0A388L942_CHABU|nr:hypothetical protein CBR_g28053 [Chara braunii]|eukprot:GBG78830.1 hypothetical protein CBR_g28053 [Chara braunii]